MANLGILLALGCALLTNIAFLCKHRGAVAAPPVRFRHPVRSGAALFRSPWFALGWAIAFVGWALHVAALTLAPLSVVQTVISGGLVLLVYPAERWFGLKLGRREWAGLILSAAGLALLAATSVGGHPDAGSSYSTAGMIGFESAAVVTGVLLLVSGTVGPRAQCAIVLGTATGILIGVSDVALKALAETVPGDPLSIISPWTAVAILAGLGGFFSLARGLQTGAAIPVITLTSVAANCSAILGGVLVFGDPIGADTLSVIARIAAFTAVIGAAALMPAPLRATGARA